MTPIVLILGSAERRAAPELCTKAKKETEASGSCASFEKLWTPAIPGVLQGLPESCIKADFSFFSVLVRLWRGVSDSVVCRAKSHQNRNHSLCNIPTSPTSFSVLISRLKHGSIALLHNPAPPEFPVSDRNWFCSATWPWFGKKKKTSADLILSQSTDYSLAWGQQGGLNEGLVTNRAVPEMSLALHCTWRRELLFGHPHIALTCS